jgi:hypothetical protein
MHQLNLPIYKHIDFMKYGENLAEECPDIAHNPAANRIRFFKSLDRLAGLNVKDMIMVMIPHPMRYAGGESNVHRIPRYEIIVLKAVGENKEIIDQVCDDCLSVHDKILKNMRYDSDALRLEERVFTYWRTEEISTELIDEPIMSDGWVGVSSVVPMGTPRSLELDINNKWA